MLSNCLGSADLKTFGKSYIHSITSQVGGVTLVYKLNSETKYNSSLLYLYILIWLLYIYLKICFARQSSRNHCNVSTEKLNYGSKKFWKMHLTAKEVQAKKERKANENSARFF